MLLIIIFRLVTTTAKAHKFYYGVRSYYLGSAEWDSNSRGEPYQFFLNRVWGRNLENQRALANKSFVSRFRFNLPRRQAGGKKLDPETGNYYYRARYYCRLPLFLAHSKVDRECY